MSYKKYFLIFLPVLFIAGVFFYFSGAPSSESQVFLCGNNIKEGTEQCDGLAGQSCTSQGYSPGSIGCTKNCQLDLSQCPGWQPPSLPPPVLPPVNNSSCNMTIARNTTHWFKASAIDPQGERLFYTFSWGDGLTDRAPASPQTVASGVMASAGHTWSQPSAAGYLVTVTATDTGNNVSIVSAPLRVCVQ